MMAEEEYSCSDDTYEGEDHEENIEMLPEEYRQHVILYRNFDQMNARSGIAKQKSRRRRWTQRDMTNAYNAVKYQGMSLRGAATAFNVPESTLRDRVHGRVSLECSRPGPPTFFTFEEEKKMVDHILFMSKIGYPYTRNQVVELAGDMTKAVGRIAPFKYLNPSQAWFYAFLNRWPDLKNFLFGPRCNRKSKGVSGDAIQSYFEQLDKVLTKYNIKDKPEHMWIVDEVSISCENQPPRILPISIQRAQSVSYWNPTVAMIGAASAAGEKIPPFLIYRGESITTNMMEGAVRGTKFANSPSGWVNSDAFIQWFLKHFRPLVSKRPLILLYDGHLQFVSVRVLERAREDGVLLFPLPPHPAYNHCVENTCFLAFQNYFEKRQDRFFEKHPQQPLVKLNVAPVLTHAYERALQPLNMVGLFEKLGICPFNNLSSSIGAYLNMPDDYDGINLDSEDGINDGGGGGGMIGPWGTPNPHNHGPGSLYHNFCSAASTAAAEEQASVDAHYTLSSSNSNMMGRSVSQILMNNTPNNFLSRDENQRPSKIKLESQSPTISSLRASNISKYGVQSPLTQQFSLPSKAGDNARLSIRLQGPGASQIRPIICGKMENKSSRDYSIINSSVASFTPILNQIQPQVSSIATTMQNYSAIDRKCQPMDSIVDFPETSIAISTTSDIPESPAMLKCYLSESDFSPSVSQISDCHLIRQMVLGEEDSVGIDSAGTVEVVEDIEEGAAPGLCAVCCQLEPPGFDSEEQFAGDANDCQVVDWAHCDYCNRWVHLNSHCSRDAVIGDDSFMCALCNLESTGSQPQPYSTV